MTTYDRHGLPLLTEDDLEALDRNAHGEALEQTGPAPERDSDEWPAWSDAYWKAHAAYKREQLEGREFE